jgi:hypothetical protein
MPASAALPETLKAITATKIEELSKQRQTYEESKRQVIRVLEQQPDLISKVQAAVHGACRIEGCPITSDEVTAIEGGALSDDLRNKRRFLRQAQADPSFSLAILRQFGEELSKEFELKSQGHIHAEFFSRLVTEWLSDSDSSDLKPTEEGNNVSDSSASFEDVGRKEMHEQRAQWDSLVFSKVETDARAIDKYLNGLFTSNKTNTKAVEDMRRQNRDFGANFAAGDGQFDSDFLKTTIKGLSMLDLLSEEKNAILKTFSSNKEVLSEICDVLNMRLMSLSTWSWSTGGKGAISLEMRKQLNGKYRVFMDEDVLDALMLHAIGLRWAVQLKDVFTKFFESRAWLRSDRPIPKVDKERREYFLGEDSSISSDANVQSKRRSQYAADYFMTQLPEDLSEGARTYDGDSDGEIEKLRKGPLEIKHSLLHLLTTESLLATILRGDFTVVRSDFKWFGPSLPHGTIFAVLRFFGVSDMWIDFFTRFLECPLRFIQDGPIGEIKTRKRGVPMSHALSDVFGEALLFCMDYAVNQKTSGSFLYRLHDDFWFWGQEKACQKAWRTMTEFARIMGIQFNEEKTGTVRLTSTTKKEGVEDRATLVNNSEDDSEDDSEDELEDESEDESKDDLIDNSEDATTTLDVLPKGEVRWGFLRLDSKTGRFQVDQSQVDDHIKELKLQLSHCSSIFSWIQAYNAYLARFFTNNFGKPSFAFGRVHVEMMIETFARIQRALFPNGSVTDHLRGVIEERFGVKDLPDGFFYFPIRMGGLELRNPLIPLFGMRDSLLKSPEQMLEQALDRDEEEYQMAKEKFLKKDTGAGLGRYSNFGLARAIEAQGEDFMPMDEYLHYREEKSSHLATIYTKLLQVPTEKEITKTPQIASWLERVAEPQSSRRAKGTKRKFAAVTHPTNKRLFLARGAADAPGIRKDWASMQPYWKWVLGVHGGEVVNKYGSVRIVDEGRVPVGVVGVMKQGRVRWRG